MAITVYWARQQIDTYVQGNPQMLCLFSIRSSGPLVLLMNFTMASFIRVMARLSITLLLAAEAACPMVDSHTLNLCPSLRVLSESVTVISHSLAWLTSSLTRKMVDWRSS